MIDLIIEYIKDRIKLKLGLYKVKDNDVKEILDNAHKVISVLKANGIKDKEEWDYTLFNMSYLYTTNKKMWENIVIISRDWGEKMRDQLH
jgi:hypothetical protein